MAEAVAAWMSSALRKGCLKLGNVGDMREDPQFDLAVVGGDDLVARLRHEGHADLASCLGADRDVLQVRLGRGEPSRRCCGKREGGMHPLRFRVHVLLQGVGIGGFQLRELPPFEDLGGKRMARLSEFVEKRRGRRPLARRRLLRARKTHLAEQDVADLLRRAEGELFACHLLDLVFEAHKRLGEFAGEAAQDLAVDQDAALLHASEDIDEGTFERLVDGGAVLGDKARLQRLP